MPLQNASAVRIVIAITLRQARVNATVRQETKAVSARVTVRAVSAARTASVDIAKQVRETVTARWTAKVAATVAKTANVRIATQALR